MSAAFHPEDEELAGFADGVLPEPRRRAVIEHIADCDDCRLAVVDSADFAQSETASVAPESPRRWWLGVAAAIIVAVGIGGFVWHQQRDPLPALVAAADQLPSREHEGRLSGFAYRQLKVMRGGRDEAPDPASATIDAKAADVLEQSGNDARTRHARGVAFLLVNDPAHAVEELAAAAAASNDATYWNDLAAAQLANGSAEAALASASRAASLDPHLPDALFNRAAALKALLRRSEAIAAYEAYLRLDPSSPWAGEARKRIAELRQNG